MRRHNRANDSMREIRIAGDYIKHPAGSVLIEFGDTKVICTASFSEGVPPFLKGSGTGWVTGEYGMLPASTHTRNQREARKGKVDGRSQEISRLLGRALRASVDMTKLGENTIIIDCDVIQADGGTRTASITGGFAALRLAVNKMLAQGVLAEDPVIQAVAAVSVGIVDGVAMLDLDYDEDSSAEVDLNLVAGADGKIVEIQARRRSLPSGVTSLTNCLTSVFTDLMPCLPRRRR
ncbi:MAG: ribonuclease PH [Geovibrio sp.]|nr:ribonuclease PH [Geovibrio sp.]